MKRVEGAAQAAPSTRIIDILLFFYNLPDMQY
jgi:hypothetical protein